MRFKVFLDKYRIYENGEIYSFKRYDPNKKIYYELKKQRKIKKEVIRGYERVCLSSNGTAKHYQVHRLVGIAFIKNPDCKPQINHKNGIRNDNRVENLEWVTPSENVIHSYKFLGRKAKKGDERWNTKIKTKDLKKIKELLEKGVSQRKVAKEFGVCQGCIQRIIKERLFI